MKEKRMFQALGSVSDKFIEEMYEPNEAQQKRTGRHPAGRMWLIAAIVAAMVLLMGCAVYVLKMQDMKQEEILEEVAEDVTVEDEVMDDVALEDEVMETEEVTVEE